MKTTNLATKLAAGLALATSAVATTVATTTAAVAAAAPIDVTEASDYLATNGTSQGNKIGIAMLTVAALVGVFKWVKRVF